MVTHYLTQFNKNKCIEFVLYSNYNLFYYKTLGNFNDGNVIKTRVRQEISANKEV